MKRLLVLGLLSLFLTGAAAVMAAPKQGTATINLRLCLDAGDGLCQHLGEDEPFFLCVQKAGDDPYCNTIEYGEVSLFDTPPGSYWAYIPVLPEGYHLDRIMVTTYPDIPYEPHNVPPGRDKVHLVLKQGVNAVNVTFWLAPDA